MFISQMLQCVPVRGIVYVIKRLTLLQEGKMLLTISAKLIATGKDRSVEKTGTINDQRLVRQSKETTIN